MHPRRPLTQAIDRLAQPNESQLPLETPPPPRPWWFPPPTTSVSASSSRQRRVSFDSLSFFWSFIICLLGIWDVTIPDFSYRETCASGHRNQLTMTVNMPMTFNMGESGRNIDARMRLVRSSPGSLQPEQ